MLKHNGTYYLMYSGSGANGPEYAIGYATSESPLGPFTKFAGNPIASRETVCSDQDIIAWSKVPTADCGWSTTSRRAHASAGDGSWPSIPSGLTTEGVLHAKVTRGSGPTVVARVDTTCIP